MTFAKIAFMAAALLASASAAAQPGEFPWQLSGGIQVPPPHP
ncbi:MAG TPA: hypothetical protein VG889_19835 [Rhizomicrobium sp.]|nr:hypothetical protein [Rhizomicrobium sp.]